MIPLQTIFQEKRKLRDRLFFRDPRNSGIKKSALKGLKKVLRDDAMQGRVREGGDHLAAINTDSKGCTSTI